MIDPFAPRNPQVVIPEPNGVYVLCEGPDDAAMVREVARQEGLVLQAATASPGFGLDTEIKAFADNAARQGPRALGIVKDKERDGAAEERKVRGWLADSGLSLPRSAGDVVHPAKEGTDLRLGYFLNPEEANEGAIEQLFVDQITENLKPCVESFLVCVEATGLWARKQNLDVRKDKVRLRAYLAARQAGENTSLNAGLTKEYVTTATPAFDSLRDFLRRLCA